MYQMDGWPKSNANTNASLCGSLILSSQLDVQPLEGKDYLSRFVFSLANRRVACKDSEKYTLTEWQNKPKQFYKKNMSATETTFLF